MLKMKKIFSILLALFFALTLFGCGGNEKQSAVNSKNGKEIRLLPFFLFYQYVDSKQCIKVIYRQF